MLKKINTVEEFNNTIKTGTWLVDFNAKWCGPCRMLEPIIVDVAKNNNVISVDIDEAEELTEKYGIMSVPSLLVFKNGSLASREVGYMPKEEIVRLLNDK